MMINRKQPIRTYQRKTVKKPLTNISLAPFVTPNKKYQVQDNCFNNNESCNDSVTHDPFETTFDRIAKGAVIPPLPLDINQSDSWNSSSSDSHVNNITNFVKSPEHVNQDLFICNNISGVSHERVKHIRQCRKPQKYKMKVIPKPVDKRTKTISIKNDIQSKIKIQTRKVQTYNAQRQKVIQYKLKKSNRKFNERPCHSGITNDLKDVVHKDVSCNFNNKHSSESGLKISEDTSVILQTTSNQANDSVITFKRTLNCYQNIKPCFVKLDTHAVQNWKILNHGKTMGNDQSSKHSILVDHNVSGVSKHMSIKPSSVVLCNNVCKNWKEKNEKNINDFTNVMNETNALRLDFRHNLSKTNLCHNTNIDNAMSDRSRNKAYLIKDSFIKMERLKVEKLVEDKVTVLNEKKKYVVSSTPIGKHKRPSAYPLLLSPIGSVQDRQKSRYENSAIIMKEDAMDMFLKQKDSSCSLITSECHKIDITNMQEQQTEVLSRSQNPTATDFAVKAEITSSNEDIYSALTQKFSARSNIRTEFPHFLNISAATNRSRSLFSDTIYNCDHSTEDVIGNNIEKKCITDTLQNKSVEILNMTASLPLSADLNLKQKKELVIDDICTDIRLVCETSSEIGFPVKTEISEDLNNTEHMRQACKNQEKQNTEMNSMKTVCKNFKNDTLDDSKHSFFSKNPDKLHRDTVNIHELLTKLQDPIRITRRMRYSKWYPNVSRTSKSLINRSTLSNNKVLDYIAVDDVPNFPSTANNLEYSANVINSSVDYSKLHDEAIQQRDSNDINMQLQRSVFLKPGKCWTRSLSILSNVNPESDLDKLCIGKGKKWRHSVRDILDMQKQGTFWSSSKKDQDDMNLSCGGLDTLIISSSDNRCKAFDSANHRFSKRVSVRVVSNNDANIKCDVKDAPFLEAFGITVENSPLKLKTLYEEKLSAHSVEYDEGRILENHPRTAKDVVLQRCSQKHYLSFSECFPDSYLEYCRKIGEGVYGEVFLYERGDEKSVIKIIPIEGKEMVNGEPQKKFSEILSEIVIAEELHKLRVHSTYRTNAFVEVRNIRCLVGRYPEKLIKLWKIYDDDKTSDNDCPSMFGEHQLYVALELGHGGEDLEAFVFQTAKEAYALFLQTALALAVAEKALEFEHRDLHWGNILISRTKESYMDYNLDGKEIKFPSNNVKVSIIDYTLSRMLYEGCCIYNDLALDPALFTAHGEYQFEIYRLMRDKIQNNWRKFEPHTNILWLHYTLDKMITAVRYKKKNLKVHKQAINKLKELKDTILNYDSAYNFVNDSNSVMQYTSI